jgi:hypothetical protein
VAGADAVERHEHVAHTIGPLGRRAALLVAVLAACLAASEVLAENAVKNVVTGEVRIVREVTLDRAHATARLPAVESQIAADETRHHRFELATVLLQVGIVVSSASVLIGVGRLLGMGALIGLAGAAFLFAGLLG